MIRILTDEQIKHALLLHSQGFSFERIADDLKVGRTTLFTAIRRYRKENKL